MAPSGLVTRFPLISAAISSTIFLSLSLLVLVAFLLPAMTRSTSQFEVAGPPPPEKAREQKVRAAPSDGSDEYEKPWTSRRRSRRGTESSGPYVCYVLRSKCSTYSLPHLSRTPISKRQYHPRSYPSLRQEAAHLSVGVARGCLKTSQMTMLRQF